MISMLSTLSWIDHDSEAHARSKRILALFSKGESRDELGLGGIRDTFSDLLFPGTSTIHTRLRYMLIVPWIYTHLEEQKIPSDKFFRKADELERSLIEPLLKSNSGERGIFGATSGTSLKHLPSDVYWGGLGEWGIRVYPGSRNQYYRDLDIIYRRRREQIRQHRKARDNQDELDFSGLCTWHPRLPDPPKYFPEELDIKMTRDESRFIQDCIMKKHGDSLLAHLALKCKTCSVPYPWIHPDWARFSSRQKTILEHARIFSQVMNGASLIYNLHLAEVAERSKLIEEHRKRLTEWESEILSEMGVIRSWIERLDQLWETVLGQGHNISRTTTGFVERWCRFVYSDVGSLLDSTACRKLVERREIQKKGSNSRFRNQRNREEWGGHSGIDRMTTRWSNVQTLLKDLYKGLKN